MIKTGDHVTIVYKGRRYAADVQLASTNEASLFLTFEAIIDGHVGMMPVLKGNDGVYRSIVTNCEVEILP